MKLNADIVFYHLSKIYEAEICGPRSTDLVLPRPRFFMDDEESFLSDHLYLATAEHLPKRPPIGSRSVLVCIGGSLQLNYYKERLCLIVIRNRADFFKVYQEIQNIFDLYDNWEQSILGDLMEGLDIRQLLVDSRQVFEGPLYVLDKSFRVIASSVDTVDASWSVSDSGALNFESLSKFMTASDLMMEKREPLRIDAYDKKILSVNLFNKTGQYEGCLCISQTGGHFVEGEEKLAEYLAGRIRFALERDPQMINDTSSIKKVLQMLVGELPLSYSQRAVLLCANNRSVFVCIYLRYANSRNRVPQSYICSAFEETFDSSYAFENGDAIVAFVDTYPLCRGQADFRAELNPRLDRFVSQMNLCAGISDEFSDLFRIRTYYLQAQAAAENGLMVDPGGHYFYFSSYSLMEMILNSLGDLPLEAYFPPGLVRLMRHDEKAGVSYLETLKVFLEENLSYTAAASRLYIHRSTLIDRIARIEKELGMDLSDPDHRLQIQMLLKAMEIEALLGK